MNKMPGISGVWIRWPDPLHRPQHKCISTVAHLVNENKGFNEDTYISNICLWICLCWPLWCEMVPHCVFNLHLSDGSDAEPSFHMSLGPLYVFLGKVSIQVLCPFFNWVVCLPGVESCEFFIYFGDQALV